MINLAETAGGGPAPGDFHRTPAVESHEGSGKSSARRFERQSSESPFWIAVNRANQAKVITGDIKQERSRHQVGLPNVVVLVAIKRLEPRAICHLVLFIVI